MYLLVCHIRPKNLLRQATRRLAGSSWETSLRRTSGASAINTASGGYGCAFQCLNSPGEPCCVTLLFCHWSLTESRRCICEYPISEDDCLKIHANAGGWSTAKYYRKDWAKIQKRLSTLCGCIPVHEPMMKWAKKCLLGSCWNVFTKIVKWSIRLLKCHSTRFCAPKRICASDRSLVV